MSIEGLERLPTEPSSLGPTNAPASIPIIGAPSRSGATATLPRVNPARERRNLRVALLFLLPNLLGFLAFTLFPMLFSLAMAFTNWSIKPAVKFGFVGLRNFSDLLGARAVTGHAAPALLAAFVCCAALLCAGLIGLLWANLAGWAGRRIGGGVLAALGAALIAAGAGSQSQDYLLIGIAALVGGAAAGRSEGEWGIGRGTVPAVLIGAAAAGLWLLRGPVQRDYVPRDAYFWQYLYNTLYLMIGIPLSIGGSLLLALLLNRNLPTGSLRQRLILTGLCCVIGAALTAGIWLAGSPNIALLVALLWLMIALGLLGNVVAYRTMFYLPTFTAGVALMILWQALYNPETGPINVALGGIIHGLHLHATPPKWLSDVVWAKPALIVMGVWIGMGGTNMLLYLAALSNVPQELLEAASIDGANRWQQFWSVTWPQLAPTTFFISVMAVIAGLQGGFEQAQVMTNGGPAGSTTTLSFYIYQKAFQDLDMGYASAISWVLFVIVFVATALNWKFGKGVEVS